MLDRLKIALVVLALVHSSSVFAQTSLEDAATAAGYAGLAGENLEIGPLKALGPVSIPFSLEAAARKPNPVYEVGLEGVEIGTDLTVLGLTRKPNWAFAAGKFTKSAVKWIAEYDDRQIQAQIQAERERQSVINRRDFVDNSKFNDQLNRSAAMAAALNQRDQIQALKADFDNSLKLFDKQTDEIKAYNSATEKNLAGMQKSLDEIRNLRTSSSVENTPFRTINSSPVLQTMPSNKMSAFANNPNDLGPGTRIGAFEAASTATKGETNLSPNMMLQTRSVPTDQSGGVRLSSGEKAPDVGTRIGAYANNPNDLGPGTRIGAYEGANSSTVKAAPNGTTQALNTPSDQLGGLRGSNVQEISKGQYRIGDPTSQTPADQNVSKNGEASNQALQRMKQQLKQPDMNMRATDKTGALPQVASREQSGMPQTYKQELAEKDRQQREEQGRIQREKDRQQRQEQARIQREKEATQVASRSSSTTQQCLRWSNKPGGLLPSMGEPFDPTKFDCQQWGDSSGRPVANVNSGNADQDELAAMLFIGAMNIGMSAIANSNQQNSKAAVRQQAVTPCQQSNSKIYPNIKVGSYPSMENTMKTIYGNNWVANYNSDAYLQSIWKVCVK